MSGDLERRYRRVLRLLPGWYRQQWEADMVAAFLDSWLTGDPDADEYINGAARPSWAEQASVASLAVRLYLGGAGAPRRYFAWGQAVRRTALAGTLVHAVIGLDPLVMTAWSRHLFRLPAPPASLVSASPGGVWPTVNYAVNVAWVVIFVTLALGNYRTARVLAALAIVPDLVALVQHQLTTGITPAPFGPWAFWVLLNLVPVLAMTAFHSGAPPTVRRPWLLALPAGYLLVYGPLLTLQATGNSAWIPDFPGLCCILAALACLAHAPRAWSRQAGGSGVWSLTLTLLAADAGAYRMFSIADYWHDPHLIAVSLAELLILVAAAALVAADAARAQAPTPAPPTVSAARMKTDGLAKENPGHVVPAPRPSSVLAGMLAAAGIMLTAASCSHITPLGPGPARPPRPVHLVQKAGIHLLLLQPRQLGSPIILQVMRGVPATPAGGCPVGSVAVSAPPGAAPMGCYDAVGTPVTITSAGVSTVVQLPQPQPPPGHPGGPAQYGFTVAVPAADVAAVTALITQAQDSRDALGVSAAGKLWQAPLPAELFSGGPPGPSGQQLQIAFLSRNQALQQYNILIPPS
jgi:hypothetical protein